MTTGSTSYMPECFVEGLLRKQVTASVQSKVSASIEHAVLVYIRSVQSAIVMAALMTSCSTAILIAKSILL